jgi:hypothetical protein
MGIAGMQLRRTLTAAGLFGGRQLSRTLAFLASCRFIPAHRLGDLALVEGRRRNMRPVESNMNCFPVQTLLSSLDVESETHALKERKIAVHVSHLSRKNTRVLGALRRVRIGSDSAIRLRACASRLVVPAPAGPDIHLLPQAPKSGRRRLSLCSLPVPKQCEESIGSFLPRPGDLLQDLAACASNDRIFVLPS